jgi:hypothetical protein
VRCCIQTGSHLSSGKRWRVWYFDKRDPLAIMRHVRSVRRETKWRSVESTGVWREDLIHVQKIKKFANIEKFANIIRLLYFDETGRRNNGKRCVLIE